MIRHVHAIEFQRPMREGSRRPALCTCVGGNAYFELVVKFRGALPRDVFGFVTEHLAAQLAKDLGLKSCETFAVEVTPTLSAAVAAADRIEFSRLIERSIGMNIGTRLITPGFNATLPSERELAKHRLMWSQIPAFDFLIQNLDRRPENPNFLRKGGEVILIDHEQAFWHIENDPRANFALDTLRLEAFFYHAFSGAVDLVTDFAALFQKFATLPEIKILSYLNGLPQEWLDHRAERAVEYLLWAREHAAEMREFLESHIVP
jgi:hypothetical protein